MLLAPDAATDRRRYKRRDSGAFYCPSLSPPTAPILKPPTAVAALRTHRSLLSRLRIKRRPRTVPRASADGLPPDVVDVSALGFWPRLHLLCRRIVHGERPEQWVAVQNIRDLRAGDALVVRRPAPSWGVLRFLGVQEFYHWAVYLGPKYTGHQVCADRAVVHWTKDADPPGRNRDRLQRIGLRVCVTPFSRFTTVAADGRLDNVFRVIASRGKNQRRLTRRQVMERALAKVGQSEYHVLFNNCEHLVRYALMGVAISYQALHVIASYPAPVLFFLRQPSALGLSYGSLSSGVVCVCLAGAAFFRALSRCVRPWSIFRLLWPTTGRRFLPGL